MKAVVFREYGEPGVLQLENVPVPEVQPGQVLIKILAAGINRLEHYLRNGDYSRSLRLPHVLGSDAAGEVAALGDGVTGFLIGERVIPMPGYPLAEADYDFQPMSAAPSYAVGGVLEWGTYAQYISVPARWVVKDTTGLPPEQVATLPMVLLTAVRAVKTMGEVRPGDRVVILAGASGTGSMAIQVARALGARVAATVKTASKIEFVKKLGAELVIDTSAADFVDPILQWTGGQGAHVAIDNLGGSFTGRSLAAVRRQGIVVALGFVAGLDVGFDVRDFFFSQKQLRGTLMGTTEELAWGLEQVRAGKIRPLLDRVLPLSEAAAAHRLVAASEVAGNLVLNPWA
jgi:NADPH:quinone reductase-like Zn-dependent oxidoreductase